MKAEIDATGMLTITPETPTDAFALRCWSQTVFGNGEDLECVPKGVLFCNYNAPLPSAEDRH